MSDRGAEAGDRDERDAADVSPAHARDAGSLAGCLIVAVILLLPALLYFGLFAALVLDEIVFRTNWLSDRIPEPVGRFLSAIYWPLLWALDQFDG